MKDIEEKLKGLQEKMYWSVKEKAYLDMQRKCLAQMEVPDAVIFAEIMVELAARGWTKSERFKLIPLDNEGHRIEGLSSLPGRWASFDLKDEMPRPTTNFESVFEIRWFKTNRFPQYDEDLKTTIMVERPFEYPFTTFLAEFKEIYDAHNQF